MLASSKILKDPTWLTGIFLLLLLVVGSHLRGKLPRTKYPDASGMYPPSFWVRKKFGVYNVNMILGGSSRVYRGLAPEEIKKCMPKGIRILNFGFSGLGLNPFIYRELEERLTDQPDESKIIVLGLGPTEVNGGTDGFLKINKRSAFILRIEEVCDWWFEPLKTPIWPMQEPVSRYIQDYKSDGWIASNLLPPRPDRYLKSIRAKYSGYNPKLHQGLTDRTNTLLDQVRKWTEKGILVVGMRMPTLYDEYYDTAYGYDEANEARLFSEAGGNWFHYSRDGLFSYDGSHLREDSARLLSHQLGEYIQRLIMHGGKSEPMRDGSIRGTMQ